MLKTALIHNCSHPHSFHAPRLGHVVQASHYLPAHTCSCPHSFDAPRLGHMVRDLQSQLSEECGRTKQAISDAEAAKKQLEQALKSGQSAANGPAASVETPPVAEHKGKGREGRQGLQEQQQMQQQLEKQKQQMQQQLEKQQQQTQQQQKELQAVKQDAANSAGTAMACFLESARCPIAHFLTVER